MKAHPQVNVWLHGRSNERRAAAAPEIDAELAAAIADTSGIQTAAPVRGSPAKKAAAKATKKVAEQVAGKKPVAGEKKEETSMVDVFKRTMKGDVEDSEEEHEEDEEEQHEKEEEEVSSGADADLQKLVDKKFAPIDDNTTGTSLGRKVGEFSKQNKAVKAALVEEMKARKELEAKLAEAEKNPKGAAKFEESEEYKTLLKRAEEAEALVDQIGLEHSPRFKEKYDNKINSIAKKCRPLVLSVKDTEKRQKLVDGLDRLLKIDPGDEGDERFYSGVSELFEELDISTFTASKLAGHLDQIRELGNEKHASLKDWKSTKGDLTRQDLEGRKANVNATKSLFATVRAGFESSQKAMLDAIRARNDLFDYDNRYKAEYDTVMPSLEKAAETGVIDETLVRYVHNGIEAPSLAFRLQLAGQEVVRLSAELATLKKKFGVVDDPTKKPKPAKGMQSEKQDDGQISDEDIKEHGGMVSTLRRMQRQ
jgi:hypothetical protein